MIPLRNSFRAIVAARRPVRRSLSMATLFAAQAAGCAAFLYAAYGYFGGASVGWAIISAILVLIPDLEQSVAAALARVAANIVGALIGLLVADFLSQTPLATIVAVVAVSYVCHVLRLDLGVRTACVAVIIVMAAPPGAIKVSAEQRFVAVIVGCLTGVTVQLVAFAAERKLLGPPAAAPPKHDASE